MLPWDSTSSMAEEVQSAAEVVIGSVREVSWIETTPRFLCVLIFSYSHGRGEVGLCSWF